MPLISATDLTFTKLCFGFIVVQIYWLTKQVLLTKQGQETEVARKIKSKLVFLISSKHIFAKP